MYSYPERHTLLYRYIHLDQFLSHHNNTEFRSRSQSIRYHSNNYPALCIAHFHYTPPEASTIFRCTSSLRTRHLRVLANSHSRRDQHKSRSHYCMLLGPFLRNSPRSHSYRQCSQHRSCSCLGHHTFRAKNRPRVQWHRTHSTQERHTDYRSTRHSIRTCLQYCTARAQSRQSTCCKEYHSTRVRTIYSPCP